MKLCKAEELQQEVKTGLQSVFSLIFLILTSNKYHSQTNVKRCIIKSITVPQKYQHWLLHNKSQTSSLKTVPTTWVEWYDAQFWHNKVINYFIQYSCAIWFREEIICSRILVLFYSLTDLSSQRHSSNGSEMWMRMSVWAVPSGHVCVLTFSTPCFPVSPLSMIHRFLRPFSLHPIDGFQSYLNFKVLMHFSSGRGSALLTYRLYKVTVKGGGRGWGKQEHLSGCIALLFLSITKAMILFQWKSIELRSSQMAVIIGNSRAVTL